jgi:hypothetical protein
MVFVMETECTFCEAGTEILNINLMKFKHNV